MNKTDHEYPMLAANRAMQRALASYAGETGPIRKDPVVSAILMAQAQALHVWCMEFQLAMAEHRQALQEREDAQPKIRFLGEDS